jgi:nucleotide-binding universal stress UspA family protein
MKTEICEPIETTAALNAPAIYRRNSTASNPPSIRLKSILVPLDFCEMSLKSLQYAVPLAKQFGAKVTLLHVLKASAHFKDAEYLAYLEREELAVIEKQLDELIPQGLSVETAVRQSFVFEAILDVAREIGADLIITTTHGHTGLRHLFKGSTAENVVRRAPCPVLVLHQNEHDFV